MSNDKGGKTFYFAELSLSPEETRSFLSLLILSLNNDLFDKTARKITQPATQEGMKRLPSQMATAMADLNVTDTLSLYYSLALPCSEVIFYCTFLGQSLPGRECCRNHFYYKPILTTSGTCYQMYNGNPINNINTYVPGIDNNIEIYTRIDPDTKPSMTLSFGNHYLFI